MGPPGNANNLGPCFSLVMEILAMLENQLQVSADGVKELAVRPAVLASDLGNGSSGLWTSLDRSNPEHQGIMVRCLGTADKRSDDVLNTILTIKHVLAHNVDLVDSSTGEVTPSVRIVLVTMEGETIGTVSKGIFSSLQSITSIVGLPPYESGLRVRIKPVATRNGYRTLVLEFLGIGAPAKEAKTKEPK